jgi:hypothetical protein
VSGPLVIGRVAFVPQPASGSRVQLAVELQGPASALELKVYTVALDLAVNADFDGSFHVGWNLIWVDISPLASGVYFYSVIAHENGDTSPRVLGKMAVIR